MTSPDRLRTNGLRWTPQRRTLIDVLREREGHVTADRTGSPRCKMSATRPTTPSTVYRTLDNARGPWVGPPRHGPGGREDTHPPAQIHGHLPLRRLWKLIRGRIASAEPAPPIVARGGPRQSWARLVTIRRCASTTEQAPVSGRISQVVSTADAVEVGRGSAAEDVVTPLGRPGPWPVADQPKVLEHVEGAVTVEGGGLGRRSLQRAIS